MRMLPKRTLQALRRLAERAHEIELSRELTALRGEFDRWERGEITAFNLSDAIHRFHQGPSRHLFVTYTSRPVEGSLGYAIHRGILDRTAIEPEVLEVLAGVLEMYDASDS